MAENNLDFEEIEQEIYEQLNLEVQDQQIEEEEKGEVFPRGAKIKKPLTAFTLYLQDIRPVLKEDLQGKGLKPTAFLTEAGKRWGVLTAEEKQKYL